MSSEALQKPRIFVVDDEHAIATTLALILNQLGFDAIAFTHPVRALEAAGTGQPQLLLTDVVMPELTGIDLAVKMLEMLPSCKVLLFSGMQDTAQLLDQCTARGHTFPILAKPIHPNELVSEIRTVLA